MTITSFPNKHLFLCVCSISLFKTVGKGEIPHNEHFLLFHLHFLPIWRIFIKFSTNIKLPSLVWTSLKFVVWEGANKLQK